MQSGYRIFLQNLSMLSKIRFGYDEKAWAFFYSISARYTILASILQWVNGLTIKKSVLSKWSFHGILLYFNGFLSHPPQTDTTSPFEWAKSKN